MARAMRHNPARREMLLLTYGDFGTEAISCLHRLGHLNSHTVDRGGRSRRLLENPDTP
jgi:hypothetical protein